MNLDVWEGRVFFFNFHSHIYIMKLQHNSVNTSATKAILLYFSHIIIMFFSTHFFGTKYNNVPSQYLYVLMNIIIWIFLRLTAQTYSRNGCSIKPFFWKMEVGAYGIPQHGYSSRLGTCA